jgi:hypothetical protein
VTARYGDTFCAPAAASSIDGPDDFSRSAARAGARFHVSEKFGQAMASGKVHLNDVDVVDKPAGLNNVTAYVGLVPGQTIFGRL